MTNAPRPSHADPTDGSTPSNGSAAASAGAAAGRLHQYPRRLTLYTLLAGVLLLADLVFKYWAFARYSLSQPPDEIIANLLALQLTYNTGAVFGLGKGYTWVFAVITVVAAVLIVTTLLRCRAHERLLPICLAMILAGALGNLYDRLFHPGVRDMLLLFPDVHLPFGLNWPGGQTLVYPWIFNLADVYLTVGILLVMAWTIVDGWRRNNRAEGNPGSPRYQERNDQRR